jgi:hypothetical protein
MSTTEHRVTLFKGRTWREPVVIQVEDGRVTSASVLNKARFALHAPIGGEARRTFTAELEKFSVKSQPCPLRGPGTVIVTSIGADGDVFEAVAVESV